MKYNTQFTSVTRVSGLNFVTSGEEVMETDTLDIFQRTTTGWKQIGTAGVLHSFTLDMLPGSLVTTEIANLTTTRQVKEYPSGATAIKFLYSQGSTSGNTAATGRAVYIVFNATSDADADGKLALAGARFRLPLGALPYGSIASQASPITRVDVVSEAAETGHSMLMIEARIPS